MFGQPASSHTVTRSSDRIVLRSARYSSPIEASTRNQGGLRLADLDGASRVDPGRGEPAEGRPRRRTGGRTGTSTVGRPTRPGARPAVHRRAPRRRGMSAPARRWRRSRPVGRGRSLGAQRRHRPVRDAARHDVGEHREVGVDVEREAVHRPAPRDPHARRRRSCAAPARPARPRRPGYPSSRPTSGRPRSPSAPMTSSSIPWT